MMKISDRRRLGIIQPNLELVMWQEISRKLPSGGINDRIFSFYTKIKIEKKKIFQLII